MKNQNESIILIEVPEEFVCKRNEVTSLDDLPQELKDFLINFSKQAKEKVIF